MVAAAQVGLARARPQVLVVTALGINLAIVLPLAFVLNVWQDDAYTLHSTSHGIAYAFHEAMAFEQNAPLYFVIMALWREIDTGAVFARMFSVLCTAGTIALLPPLVSRYLPRANPWWVVLTLSINPFTVWAALEIRVYALIVVLSALLLLAFYDGFLREDARREVRLCFALLVAVSMYTQYYFAFFIAAMGIVVFLQRRRVFKSFVAFSVLGIVPFLPLAAMIPAQVHNFKGAFEPPATPLHAASTLFGSLLRFVFPLDFLAHPTRVYIAVVAVAAIARFLRRRDFGKEGDGTIAAITAAAFVLFSLGVYAAKVHIINRHAAFLFIPSCMSCVAALTYLKPRRRNAAIAAWCICVTLLSAAALTATYRAGAKPGDWARVVAYIEARERAGEPILVFQAENTLPLEYYYRGPNRIVGVPQNIDFSNYNVAAFAVRSKQDIERAVPRGARRLWWIDAGECKAANIDFGCGIVDRYIARHYQIVSSAQFYRATVLGLVPLQHPAASGAAFGDCPVFSRGDTYNRVVANDPVDPHSSDYIASMQQAGNRGGFWAEADAVEYVNVAAGSTPRVPVRPKVRYHSFPEPYPWSADFKIEPLSDAHAMVVSLPDCRLYESYETSYASGSLSAYSGAAWNLRAPFEPMPPGTPSAMASGLSLFAGAIRYEEVLGGVIRHALNWSAPAGTVAEFEFVRPASDTDWLAFKGTSGYRLPYGARLRLRRDFDVSAFGPQSKAIAHALQTYGMYLADTGSHDNGLYNAVPLDGRPGWNAADLAALERIKISDFEVLRLGPVQRVPGH